MDPRGRRRGGKEEEGRGRQRKKREENGKGNGKGKGEEKNGDEKEISDKTNLYNQYLERSACG